MVIDACHSGSTIGRSTSIPMSRSLHEEMFSEAEGFAILSSCQIGQLSYDYPEKNHGAFSYYLLEGLRGLADNDGDSIITVPDANNYVSKKLREWSISKGLQQNPTFSYNVSGDFIFVRTPTQEKPEMKQDLILSVEISESEYTIFKFLEEFSFMSYRDAYSRQYTFDNFEAYLFSGDTVEKGKAFLKTLVHTRFSDTTPKELLMKIVAEVTELNEIKKWLRTKKKIKQFFILEVVTSRNFARARIFFIVILVVMLSLRKKERCPVCGATWIEKTPKQWTILGIPVTFRNMRYKYRCRKCEHEWEG